MLTLEKNKPKEVPALSTLTIILTSQQRFSHFDVTRIIELNGCGSYPRNGRGFIPRKERNEILSGTSYMEKRLTYILGCSNFKNESSGLNNLYPQ